MFVTVEVRNSSLSFKIDLTEFPVQGRSVLQIHFQIKFPWFRTSWFKAWNSFSCGTMWSGRDAMLSLRLVMSSADPAFLFSHGPFLVQAWALLLISQAVDRVISRWLFQCLRCHGVWQFRGSAGSIWCISGVLLQTLMNLWEAAIFFGFLRSSLSLGRFHLTLEPLVFKFSRLHVWFRV